MKREMLIDARKKFGLSQLEVSKYIGVNQPMVSKIELGTRNPNLEQSKLLIKLLKINLKML